MVCFTCNHGQKVWDTLGNVIQVNPPPPPTPTPRTGQCWMLKGKIPFTHPAQVMDLNFDRGRWRRNLSLTLTSTVYSLPLTFEDYWLGWSAKQNNK